MTLLTVAQLLSIPLVAAVLVGATAVAADAEPVNPERVSALDARFRDLLARLEALDARQSKPLTAGQVAGHYAAMTKP